MSSSQSLARIVGGDAATTIRLLERLAADLRRLHEGGPPDLAGAPLLNSWQLARRTVTALAGSVSDHPYCGPGPVCTSELYAIDPGLSWCRTLSRYYRLGARLDAAEVRS